MDGQKSLLRIFPARPNERERTDLTKPCVGASKLGVRGRLTFISGSEICIFKDPEVSESWECLKIRAEPVVEAEGEGQVGGWVGT